jgi:hypothetical protein
MNRRIITLMAVGVIGFCTGGLASAQQSSHKFLYRA